MTIAGAASLLASMILIPHLRRPRVVAAGQKIPVPAMLKTSDATCSSEMTPQRAAGAPPECRAYRSVAGDGGGSVC